MNAALVPVSPLKLAVQGVEHAAAALSQAPSAQARLDMTLALLALRRAADLPAKLAGPAGRLGPESNVVPFQREPRDLP